MKERIKILRKTLGLTQQEFGEKIGLKRNSIASYEIGRNEPMDAVVVSICREFNVNEAWLKTGEGKMFIELTRDERLAAWAGTVLSEKNDGSFMRQLANVLSRLNVEDWKVLERIAKLMIEEHLKAEQL